MASINAGVAWSETIRRLTFVEATRDATRTEVAAIWKVLEAHLSVANHVLSLIAARLLTAASPDVEN